MSRPPNILLLILDSVRADHLGCYGYWQPTSPHLDKLARQGVRFSLAVSPGAGTLTSLPSILTGRSVPEHGVGPRSPWLSPNLGTMAEWLKERNFQTFALSANPYFGPATGMDRGFHCFSEVCNPRLPLPLGKSLEIRLNRLLRAVATYRFDKGAGAIVSKAKKHLQSAAEKRRPFFGVLHFMDAHSPYFPPSPFFERFLVDSSRLKRESLLKKLWRRMFDCSDETGFFFLPDGEHAAEDLKALYDGGILYLDARLGELVDWMDRQGLLQRTLLIVTADHGENLGDHGLWGHGHCLYHSLVNVPLLLRYPNRIEAGCVQDALVQSHDIFSTVKTLVDEKQASPEDLQRSLLPERIAGQDRMYAFAADPVPGKKHLQALGLDPQRLNRSLLAVRSRQAKWIESSDGRHEFYHLEADPSESSNLYPGSHPALQSLKEALTRWKEKIRIFAGDNPPRGNFDAALRDRLRSLGYFH